MFRVITYKNVQLRSSTVELFTAMAIQRAVRQQSREYNLTGNTDYGSL